MVGGYNATRNMRLAPESNPFLERETKSDMRVPKIQYIVFAEGVETEKLYFESLSRSKRKKDSIIIRYFDRWKANIKRSNQLSVVNDVIEYVNKVKNELSINSEELEELLRRLVENVTVEELPTIVNQLSMLTKEFPDVFNSKEPIQSQLFSCLTLTKFDSDYDKIFIILDRDRHSFTKEQFEEALLKSQANNLFLGITNPCFEFFLLLHFDDIIDLKYDELKENAKTGKKTYVERQLAKYLVEETGRTFRKNNYDTEFFINRIDVALTNVEKFEIENVNLEDNVGSSVVNIVKEMIN
ncbi:RloB family protein [Streptococcus suis]|uniref:RloB family protein n=1 Tax=Streptococcus suis TaxID=1307 RepID=UPI000C17B465|nr:RloB family protein [Streptococcus suis]